MKILELTDAEVAMLKTLKDDLENIPGGGQLSEQEDDALWSFIGKVEKL